MLVQLLDKLVSMMFMRIFSFGGELMIEVLLSPFTGKQFDVWFIVVRTAIGLVMMGIGYLGHRRTKSLDEYYRLFCVWLFANRYRDRWLSGLVRTQLVVKDDDCPICCCPLSGSVIECGSRFHQVHTECYKELAVHRGQRRCLMPCGTDYAYIQQ